MFNKLKKIKLYAEAEEEEVQEETTPEVEEGAEPIIDEPEEELSNDFGDFEDVDLDTPDDYDANNYFDANITDDTGSLESAEYKRRNLKLELAYGALYDKYVGEVEKLKNMDVAGDRAVVISTIIKKYESILDMLVSYKRFCKDPFEIRYETFIKYRAMFITINEQLESIDSEVNILQH